MHATVNGPLFRLNSIRSASGLLLCATLVAGHVMAWTVQNTSSSPLVTNSLSFIAGEIEEGLGTATVDFNVSGNIGGSFAVTSRYVTIDGSGQNVTLLGTVSLGAGGNVKNVNFSGGGLHLYDVGTHFANAEVDGCFFRNSSVSVVSNYNFVSCTFSNTSVSMVYDCRLLGTTGNAFLGGYNPVGLGPWCVMQGVDTVTPTVGGDNVTVAECGLGTTALLGNDISFASNDVLGACMILGSNVVVQHSRFSSGRTQQVLAIGISNLFLDSTFCSNSIGLEIRNGKYCKVKGCRIGTDPTGAWACPNAQSGLRLQSCYKCEVGGTLSADRNTISGNGNNGVEIAGGDGITIEGNYIGLDSSGLYAIPNLYHGIQVYSGSNHFIGATDFGGENVIAGNGRSGINAAGTELAIVSNVVGLDVNNVPEPNGTYAFYTGAGIEFGCARSIAIDNVVCAQSNGFGIRMMYGNDNVVQGNRIGLTPNGTSAGCALHGITSEWGTNNLIGGELEEQRNIVCDNGGCGLYLAGDMTGTRIVNNYLGIKPDGGSACGNGAWGILCESAEQLVLGPMNLALANIVSGNASGGVFFMSSRFNIVQANLIGTDFSGTMRVPNGGPGILFSNSPNSRIGSTNAWLRNIISGNDGDGIQLIGLSSNTTVWGNYIGMDIDGTQVVHNTGNGIYTLGRTLYRPSFSDIGGVNETYGELTRGNLVAGNLSNGIYIGAHTEGTRINGNYIGVDVSAMKPAGNGGHGILSEGGDGMLGTDEGNVIAGNGGDGIRLATGYRFIRGFESVQNNIIGLDRNMVSNYPNLGNGVSCVVSSYYNTIGLTYTSGWNVICGNKGHGVYAGSFCDGTKIKGNYIGSLPSGALHAQNGGAGIMVQGFSTPWVGGLGAEERNVVFGHTGIVFDTIATAYNYNNWVGYDPDGQYATSMVVGILVKGSSQVRFGQFDASNYVGNAREAAIAVYDSTNTAFDALFVGIHPDGSLEENKGDGMLFSNTLNSSVGPNVHVAMSRVGILLVDTTNSLVASTYVGTKGTWGGDGTSDAAIRILRGNADRIGNVRVAGNAGHGIEVRDSDNVRIYSSWVGLATNGMVACENRGDGIRVIDSRGTRIGSPANYIAGNGSNGVYIVGNKNGERAVTMGMNYIGFATNRVTAVSNDLWGILVNNSRDNMIGGDFTNRCIVGNCGRDGILLNDTDARGNVVVGNYVGVANDQTTAAAVAQCGIRVAGAPANIVGLPGLPNAVGNCGEEGIRVQGTSSSNNMVGWNLVGLTPSFNEVPMPNMKDGIAIVDAEGNHVSNNIVGGNMLNGILVANSTPSDLAMFNTICGNWVGFNSSGSARPNGCNGVRIVDATFNYIGLSNVIGYNLSNGVEIAELGSHDNFVQGNFIGVQPVTSAQLGNRMHGVQLLGGDANRVGGTNYAWESNFIAHNYSNGVNVASGVRNRIQGNTLTENWRMGINLEPMSRTDGPEQDGTPNRHQRYPVVTKTYGGSATLVSGVLTSAPNAAFALEFFANDAVSLYGFAQAAHFVGRTNAFTDSAGVVRFSYLFPYASASGMLVTATATDTNGNTSELSVDTPVVPGLVGAAFSLNKSVVATGEVVQFTDESVGGPSAWMWDFDNNGSTDSTQRNPSYTYPTPGYKSVKLTATNAMTSSVLVKTNVLLVGGTVHYVTNTGDRLQDIIDASAPGDIIVLTAGMYRAAGRLSNGSNVFVLDRDILVTSMSALPGQQAVIDGQGLMRCATVLSGTVMGVTFANGYSDGIAGGVWCAGSGALLDRCVIRNCNAGIYGGGAYVLWSTVRSCLIISNTAGTSGGGGIMMDFTGFVYNCTIADNSAVGRGGGIATPGGLVANCIVFSNSSSLGSLVANWYTNDIGGTFSHCVTTPEAPGPNNIVNDPQMLAGYLIDLASPCYDQGIAYPWMDGASDLAGAPRRQGTAPDIGAYEAVPEPAIAGAVSVVGYSLLVIRRRKGTRASVRRIAALAD